MDRFDGADDWSYDYSVERERRRIQKIKEDRDKEIDDLLKKENNENE